MAGLTAAEITADPFGAADRLMDTPAYVTHAFRAGDRILTKLGSMSADEIFYFSVYVQAADQQPKLPALLTAVFAAAVATVEPLVSRMVQLLLYETAPDTYISLADPSWMTRCGPCASDRQRSGARRQSTRWGPARSPTSSTGMA